MVTQLNETNKVKANQYWPDKDNKKMDLKDGARIELLDTSFQGNYHIRLYKRTIVIKPCFQEVLLDLTRRKSSQNVPNADDRMARLERTRGRTVRSESSLDRCSFHCNRQLADMVQKVMALQVKME